MQKRVLNISTHLSSLELGTAREVIKKHATRLNPRWDYDSYRADVMAARGDHLIDKHHAQATPSLRQGNPEEYMKDHRDEPVRSVISRRGVHDPVRGMDSSGGSAPVKGRPEECMDDHLEPARTVMTRWGIHTPVRGMDSTGGLDFVRVSLMGDSMDAGRVERYATRVERYADRALSESSYSERDDAEAEIQDLRSELAKERRRNQELESMAERAEHHSEMASTISALMRTFQ
eukprot:237958-Amphidinium_carterae.2